MLLPMKIIMNTREVEEEISVSTKDTAKQVLNLFKKPSFEFSKQWKHLQRLEKVFTVLFFLFLLIRNDLFTMLLMLFYLCYASLFSLHIPFVFYYWSSIALSVWIVLKFIVQSSFVTQYIRDGVCTSAACPRERQGSHPQQLPVDLILGLYKTDKDYVGFCVAPLTPRARRSCARCSGPPLPPPPALLPVEAPRSAAAVR